MVAKRCETCNSIMFEAEPFKTTPQDIVEFAHQSSLAEAHKQSLIHDKWIQPGLYCPNGCTTILDEVRIRLPEMTTSESIAIAAEYSRKHHQEFIQTHGANSRIVACVHCAKFGGAVIEGESRTALYHEPKYRSLHDSQVISARCADHRIQMLNRAWWYASGKEQPECDYFEYDRLFKWTYRAVTGWSEYPDTSMAQSTGKAEGPS